MAERIANDAADFALNMANARGIQRVCQFLYMQGTIDRAGYDALKHLYLHEFDSLGSMGRLRPDALAAIEQMRETIERTWTLREDADPHAAIPPE